MEIVSSEVGVRINDWYNVIRKHNIDEALIIKSEIEQKMKSMDDKDLSIYYNLMSFRHQMMIDYVDPAFLKDDRIELPEELKDSESKKEQFNGLIEYYFNFFRGMHEFNKGLFIKAILFYKRAEKKLDAVSDEIERAEFNYKVSEVYYHMKQTQVSLLYAMQAFQTYQAYEIYTVRRMHCEFVIAGNYDDLHRPDKALPYLESALYIAKLENNHRLIGAALYNLGNCFLKMGDFATATQYFRESVNRYVEGKLEFLTHSVEAWFSLTQILFKQKDIHEAKRIYEEGLAQAYQLKEEGLIAEFHFLKSLYLEDGDTKGILDSFSVLESKGMYPDIEEFALEAAKYFSENGKYKDSSLFYEKMIEAQKQIRKEGSDYEI